MSTPLKILALIGSTKDHSSNHKIITYLKSLSTELSRQPSPSGQSFEQVNLETFPIAGLPFFNPDLDQQTKHSSRAQITSPPSVQAGSMNSLPTVVRSFRDSIAAADAMIICTPEYVFSLPGVLKNALEWLVSTTLLEEKPMALITAAASGEKAKESLEIIIKTLGGKFSPTTSILIRGISGKFDPEGQLSDEKTTITLQNLYQDFLNIIANQKGNSTAKSH